jgi:hypothetical protein
MGDIVGDIYPTYSAAFKLVSLLSSGHRGSLRIDVQLIVASPLTHWNSEPKMRLADAWNFTSILSIRD